MAVKVDLYSTHEGKESSAGTSARRGGCGDGEFFGQKGKLGTVEEGFQLDLVATVAKKKSYKS